MRSFRVVPMLILPFLMPWDAAIAEERPTAPTALEAGFQDPPEATKPWCYWYWISDNISEEGITKDLEAMAEVGIGEAFIGNIFLDEIPAGNVKVLSPSWWKMVEHTVREGSRLGVNIGMFNCPGWSQSGGPWIKTDQAMRYLVSSEVRVRGPVQFARPLPLPADPFQDVALVAFPAPKNDADSLKSHSPHVSCRPAVPDVAQVVDGKLDTALVLPAEAGRGKNAFVLEITLKQPLNARSLSLIPFGSAWAAQCELQAADDDGDFQVVRRFGFDRSNMKTHVGPMPRGPVTVAFEPITSRKFRLLLTGVTGDAALAEIELSQAARLESFVEKQLGKMHPTPLPMWDTYLWPAQPEPNPATLSIAPSQVVDLSDKMTPEGMLHWEVPPGEWVILRTGMTTTGTLNSPASPEGQGLEVDKMNRPAAAAHFDAFVGELLRRLPGDERRALTHIVADSYEMGSQNWTDGFETKFRGQYGYDPTPWLPVLTGRIMGSADQSDRFLWDLRRLVADRIAMDYVGGLRDLCRAEGLKLWLENYGHWGFPAEFLQYGGQSDCLGGEFWITGSLGSIECRAASSAANIYGLPFVSSEAFTGGPPFRTVPSGLKARGDWAFCEGINHFVLHVNIHQPWEQRRPGVNAWFGTEFNRHNTWFHESTSWIDYLRRCCFLLQQGTRVADVAYFIGEDTPKMTGIRQPELPPGRDFDYINAEVIQNDLSVEEGLLSLPHGTRYRLLVLPNLKTMRPELLRKIRDLVESGATILGPAPERSPSLEQYPACDAEIRNLAAELWGGTDVPAVGEHRFGEGRVVWGKSLSDVFHSMDCPVDFNSSPAMRYTHRIVGDSHIYFVANPQPQEVLVNATFRVRGKVPEFWWADSGRIQRPAVYQLEDQGVRMPICLGPHESVFVVFRKPSGAGASLVAVRRDGKVLMDAAAELPPEPVSISGAKAAAADNFTFAVWARPADTTTLLSETNRGVRGMAEPRNDALPPPHGSDFGDASHAGCGLAVGQNGVCVFEHGANYFAPLLSHAVRLPDWTHLAVVYRDGQPSLFVNGRFAHTGLKSEHTVHGDIAAAGGSQFRGELGAFKLIPRAMQAPELANLPDVMIRPGMRPPAATVELTHNSDGSIGALAWQAGNYVLQTSQGKSLELTVGSLPEPLAVSGPWQVRFMEGWGAPPETTFGQLQDWTQHDELGIKYYSGRATYRTKFTLPESWEDRPLWLDLGEVRDLATVRLNGTQFDTLWMAPWKLEITAVAAPGENQLEIDIVNPWNNRLVGDAGLPPDKRSTFLAKNTLPKNTPLLPAGLLGPVTLQTAERVSRFVIHTPQNSD